MKAEWQIKTLGDVCDKASSNVAQNQLKDEVGEYPIFGASGLIKNVSFYHHDKPYLSIVKDGSGVGRVTKMDAFTSVIGTLQYILPKDGIDLDYLNYSLMSVDFKKYVAGAAIPHIYFKDYKNEPFLWMPLPEQQRIVTILDEVFAGIATATANAEKNLANARELFESTLQLVFANKGNGWIKKSLTDVCEIASVLVDPRGKEYLDMLHVGGANIESKSGRLLDLKTAREEGLISGKFVFDESMVLYSKIRPYLMKVARPDFQGVCSADIYPLSVKTGQLDRDFLFYLLFSPEFTSYANAGSARAGMPKVNRDHLFAFCCHFPTLAKQREYSVKLDELSAETKKLQAIYQQKLIALNELKKSILNQAFSGQLQ